MKLRLLLLIIPALVIFQKPALANPTQYGASGLLNVPTADTIDSANICIGVWGNCNSRKQTGINTIMPVTLTLGIGTFWEVYGTYPNVYLNDETPFSGRGTADVGTKLRIIGQRSSKFKMAADLRYSRYIDDVSQYNGITDLGTRLIASLNSDLIGVHMYGGYMSNGNSRDVVSGTKSGTEYPYGVGVEISPSNRSKLTLEFTGADAVSFDAPVEASLGFQYYLSPHLTFNLSYGMGLNDAAADWRVVFGLSTCQGVGAYIKPIPMVSRIKDKSTLGREFTKPFKVVPLSPLLIKTPALTTPSSKFEVPVDPDAEEVLFRPYGTVIIAQQPAATPVTLPKVATDEIQPVPAAEPVPEPPIVVEQPESTEYSLSRVSGVTPLYGVRLKGAKTAVAKPLKVPPVKAYKKFRLPDNLFEFDNAEMIPEVKKSISDLAEFIRKDEKWLYMRIDGHTDGVGSVRYNLDLSLKRAIAVANYLITREGMDPARIFVRGMGKSAPIADNSTDEGRKLNRRFEIVFLVNKESK